jgi:hypothetical protein
MKLLFKIRKEAWVLQSHGIGVKTSKRLCAEAIYYSAE